MSRPHGPSAHVVGGPASIIEEERIFVFREEQTAVGCGRVSHTGISRPSYHNGGSHDLPGCETSILQDAGRTIRTSGITDRRRDRRHSDRRNFLSSFLSAPQGRSRLPLSIPTAAKTSMLGSYDQTNTLQATKSQIPLTRYAQTPKQP
jgi:hypothetical protein